MSDRPHVLLLCHSPVSKQERVSPIETYKNSNEHEFWPDNGQMRACALLVALCFFVFHMWWKYNESKHVIHALTPHTLMSTGTPAPPS